MAIVVTNQPVIARNLCSLEELDYIHAKLETLLGYDGYYAGLKALLAHMVKMGLSSPERQSGIYFAKELDEIKSILKRA